MAHLEVKRKQRMNWWIWLLLLLFVLILIFIWIRGDRNYPTTDKLVSDSSASLATDQKEAIAITEPDWDKIDFNAPEVKDPDIEDPNISIRQGAAYTIYTLGENILFNKDQRTIQSSSEPQLRAIATILKKRFDGAHIGIYGSTDSTGSAEHNNMLGTERANEVKNWLVDHGGIDYAKITVHSIGEREPIANNRTNEGRQQNRNVQIVVFQDANR